MTKEDGFYQDEFSAEVFDLFEQKMYPSEVGGLVLFDDRKELDQMYAYWMEQKRAAVNEGDRVEFVISIDGFESELAQGVVIIKKKNSVIVELDEGTVRSDLLKDKLQGKIAVSVKSILTI